MIGESVLANEFGSAISSFANMNEFFQVVRFLVAGKTLELCTDKRNSCMASLRYEFGSVYNARRIIKNGLRTIGTGEFCHASVDCEMAFESHEYDKFMLTLGARDEGFGAMSAIMVRQRLDPAEILSTPFSLAKTYLSPPS